jgi:hypothetical protein
MSVGKQEQQRLRKARQQPIISEEDSNVGLPDPTSVPAPPPKLDTCLDVVSAVLANPNRAMLRRVFFIAEDKSKFLSVGHYPARGYQPLAEFGGAKKLPLLLDAQQLQRMAENIAALFNALSRNEHFSKKDGDFKMNTTGSYRIARVYLGKPYLSFTYEELRNLAYIMYMIQNQITFYTAAMTDVIVYIDTAHDSVTFVEPPSTANESINYYQLFEEINPVLTF